MLDGGSDAVAHLVHGVEGPRHLGLNEGFLAVEVKMCRIINANQL